MNHNAVKLNIRNLHQYLLHPRDPKLSATDQKIALVCTIVIGVLSLGIVPLILLAKRRWRHVGSEQKQNGVGLPQNVVNVTQKISAVQTVEPAPTPSPEPAPAPAPTPEPVLPIAKPVQQPVLSPIQERKRRAVSTLSRISSEISKSENIEELRFAVRGMPNMGNTCYFNSAVQCAEAILIENNGERLLGLLKQDLSLKEGETFEQLEARVLGRFYPVTMDGNEARDYTLRSEEYDFNLRFKWSFLVMLQAKHFGTEEQLKEAIRAHREIFFNVKKNSIFNERTWTQQLAADEYLNLFIDAFNMHMDTMSTVFNKSAEVISNQHSSSLDMLRFAMGDSDEQSFSALLGALFKEEGINDVYSKKVSIDGAVLPNQLFISAGRINTEGPQAIAFKNNAKINWDLGTDQIDFTLYCSDMFEGAEANYQLVAFNVHSGVVDAGHYVAYVRKEDGWYCLNDSQAYKCHQAPPFGNAFIMTFKKV